MKKYKRFPPNAVKLPDSNDLFNEVIDSGVGIEVNVDSPDIREIVIAICKILLNKHRITGGNDEGD